MASTIGQMNELERVAGFALVLNAAAGEVEQLLGEYCCLVPEDERMLAVLSELRAHTSLWRSAVEQLQEKSIAVRLAADAPPYSVVRTTSPLRYAVVGPARVVVGTCPSSAVAGAVAAALNERARGERGTE